MQNTFFKIVLGDIFCLFLKNIFFTPDDKNVETASFVSRLCCISETKHYQIINVMNA